MALKSPVKNIFAGVALALPIVLSMTLLFPPTVFAQPTDESMIIDDDSVDAPIIVDETVPLIESDDITLPPGIGVESGYNPDDMLEMKIVTLQGLDKITARTSKFEVIVGETVKFGSLYIQPRACYKNPPEEMPESAAFLQIWEQKEKSPQWVFSNWMFASSPALSAMDHAVYDVWVLDCKNKDTNSDSEDSSEPPAE